jgi:hypothetical protein
VLENTRTGSKGRPVGYINIYFGVQGHCFAYQNFKITCTIKVCNVLLFLYMVDMERGSSVSIVSDYGLDDRGSIPDRAEDFSSSLCVQTGSGAHPACCTMGTRGSFPGGKARPGRDADHSPPSSAEVVPSIRLQLLQF